MTRKIIIIRTDRPGLSSLSKKSADNLKTLFDKQYISSEIRTISCRSDLEKLVKSDPILVFIGIKYIFDLDGVSKIWIASYLSENKVDHTGSASKAIENEQDKSKAKAIMQINDVTTSPFTVIAYNDVLNMSVFNMFPLFVKPLNFGAGKGVDSESVVNNRSELANKVNRLRKSYKADVLVEQYLTGREFSVAVMQNDEGSLQAMPIELHPDADINGNFILSHSIKSSQKETEVSYVEDDELRNKLKTESIKAFKAIGAEHYGRIDLRLDECGKPNFLEANLIPCLIEGSGNFLKACLINNDLSYEQAIMNIVKLGKSRVNKTENKRFNSYRISESPVLI